MSKKGTEVHQLAMEAYNQMWQVVRASDRLKDAPTVFSTKEADKELTTAVRVVRKKLDELETAQVAVKEKGS